MEKILISKIDRIEIIEVNMTPEKNQNESKYLNNIEQKNLVVDIEK